MRAAWLENRKWIEVGVHSETKKYQPELFNSTDIFRCQQGEKLTLVGL